MTTAIVDSSTGEIIVDEQANGLVLVADGFQFTPTGLVIEGQPTFELWQAVGLKLQAMKNAIQWWIGDWLNYGEARWGEMYAQAVEQTSYTEGSLANMKWVASKVQPSQRNEQLSYSHHIAVAPLPPEEQEQLLTKAVEESWTTRQLQAKVHAPPLPPASVPDDKIVGTIDYTTRIITLYPRTLAQVEHIRDDLLGDEVVWR
ncbi:MAG: DUF1016 domain-containing protein [Deltaproteobacteria bacterium]|nr:DUF1016 domain-containing protein [Deltaproteobacteria bacterium]